jgi:NADH-quinone oxidoreductase subunit H
MPAMAAWAVIPFGPDLALANINAGLLFRDGHYVHGGLRRGDCRMGVQFQIFVFGCLACFGADGELRNCDGFLSGDRADGVGQHEPDRHRAGQGKGYFAQAGWSFLSWNWLPLLPIFVVYIISGLAETNRHPFDVVEGKAEIVAGTHGGVFRYVICHVLFGGVRQYVVDLHFGDHHVLGWLVVTGDCLGLDSWLDLVGIKTCCAVVSLFIWVRATFPRFRYDQIMRLGWKVFIPLTLVWLVVMGAWMQTSFNIWK